MIINANDAPKVFVKGELHTTSANGTTGDVLTLYERGSLAARSLAANERLCITAVIMVCDTAGDTYLFVGADSTPGAGETVARGKFAANGGVSTSVVEFMGIPGALAYGFSTAGADVDIIIYGYIM